MSKVLSGSKDKYCTLFPHMCKFALWGRVSLLHLVQIKQKVVVEIGHKEKVL